MPDDELHTDISRSCIVPSHNTVTIREMVRHFYFQRGTRLGVTQCLSNLSLAKHRPNALNFQFQLRASNFFFKKYDFTRYQKLKDVRL
jgi:hypothetical protein